MLGIITAIVSLAAGLASKLAVVGLAVEGLKLLGNMITGIAKALGLIKKDVEVDELGDKALQAEEAGIKPERYETYEQYVRAVEEFELDPAKSLKYSDAEKTVKGIELSSGVTIEKFPGLPVADFYQHIATKPEYFTTERMKEFPKFFTTTGINIGDVLKYMNGTEKNSGKLDSVIESLKSIEKTIRPEISDRDALKNVLSTREHNS